MRKTAQAVRRAGRYGDTELVHLNARELGYLSRTFGKPTRNPKTGLPEFFDFGGFLKSIIAPIVGSAIGAGPISDLIGSVVDVGDWGQTIGGGLAGALTSGVLNGFNPGSLLSGAGLGAATPTAANALGFNSFQSPFNIPQLFDLPSALGMGNSAAAAAKAMQTGASYDGIGEMITKNGLGGAAGSGVASAGAAPAAAAPSGIGALLSKNPAVALSLLGGLAAAGSGGGGQQTQSQPVNTKPSSWTNYTFPQQQFSRKQNIEPLQDPNAPPKPRRPPGEYNFFADNMLPQVPIAAAKGGRAKARLAPVARATRPGAQLMQEPMSGALNQGYVRGPGDGRADIIPANLSNDEYVIDAETVALLGNGSPNAGARKLDQFRHELRRHKGRALAKGKFSPNAKPVMGYLSRAA